MEKTKLTDVEKQSQEEIKSKYKYAFMKHFDLKSTEFKVKKNHHGYMAKHKDKVYNIWSDNDMESYCKEILTGEPYLHINNVDVWIEIAESVHTDEEFYSKFLEVIEGNIKNYTQLLQDYNLAMSISKNNGSSCYDFWKTVYEIQGNTSSEIFDKCVNAAAKVYDLDSLADELSQELIADGDFIEMKNGIFETIYLGTDEDEEKDDDTDKYFYIFTIDGVRWENK